MKHLFYGGVHPKYNKEMSVNDGTLIAIAPKTVVIPMLQHIGEACTPLVKAGDRVLRGQKIGDGEGLCVPVHASVSGTVLAVETRPHPKGGEVLSVVIENDFLDEAIEVVTAVQSLNKDDYRLLIEQMISVDPQTKQVRWIAETCPQRYQDIKKLATAGRLYLCRGCQLLNLMPVKLLKVMPNIIIMTFLFEASHLYLYMRLHSLRWYIAHIAARLPSPQSLPVSVNSSSREAKSASSKKHS